MRTACARMDKLLSDCGEPAEGNLCRRKRPIALVHVRAARYCARDVDEQRSNPLGVLRAATRFPTRVLRDAGAAEVRRDLGRVRQGEDSGAEGLAVHGFIESFVGAGKSSGLSTAISF